MAAIRGQCHYVNKNWIDGISANWSPTETRLHNRCSGKNQINLCQSTLLPIYLTRFQAVAGGKAQHIETVDNSPISTTELGVKVP